MYNVISYWLKYYRTKCGLTQQDVADLLGLERSSYTYYETGKITPDVETLVRLSKIYNVDFYDLLSGCNTETGKNVNDARLKELINSVEHKSYDELSEAEYENEVMLRIRSLNEQQRKEVMAFLDDITEVRLKDKEPQKSKVVLPKETEIPKKELELLEKADARNLPKKKRRRIDNFFD